MPPAGSGAAPAAPGPELGPLDSLRPRRSPRFRTGLTVAIAISVAAASIGGYAVYREVTQNRGGFPTPPPGWGTLDTAWSGVSNALASVAQGPPWTVRFVEGLAADRPWAPPIAVWAGEASDWWSPCAALLSGISTLTFWNASAYPYSTSPTVFTSGAAPLWTFIFNGSAPEEFVATWLEGHVIVNAELGPTSACSGLPLFEGVPYMEFNPATYLDSNAIAARIVAGAAAFPNVVSLPSTSTPAFVAYFPGPQLFPDVTLSLDLWTAAYGQCGLPSELGQPTSVRGYEFDGLANASWSVNSWAWYSFNIFCYNSEYTLNLTSGPNSSSPSAAGVYRSWSLNWSFMTSAVPPTLAASDLNTSMVQWELTAPAFPYATLPSAPAKCGPGDRNVSNCSALPDAWYAVLLGPSGSWLDSYPSSTNGTSWSVPDVPLSTSDTVMLVAPVNTSANATFMSNLNAQPSIWGFAPVGAG